MNVKIHVSNVRAQFANFADLYPNAIEKNRVKSWATMVRAYLDYLEAETEIAATAQPHTHASNTAQPGEGEKQNA